MVPVWSRPMLSQTWQETVSLDSSPSRPLARAGEPCMSEGWHPAAPTPESPPAPASQPERPEHRKRPGSVGPAAQRAGSPTWGKVHSQRVLAGAQPVLPHEPVLVAVPVLWGRPSRAHGSWAACAGGQALAAAGLLLVPVAFLRHGAPSGPGDQVKVEGQQQSEAAL